MCVCVYIYIYVCVCVYIYVYMCVYICICIYIYFLTWLGRWGEVCVFKESCTAPQDCELRDSVLGCAIVFSSAARVGRCWPLQVGSLLPPSRPLPKKRAKAGGKQGVGGRTMRGWGCGYQTTGGGQKAGRGGPLCWLRWPVCSCLFIFHTRCGDASFSLGRSASGS